MNSSRPKLGRHLHDPETLEGILRRLRIEQVRGCSAWHGQGRPFSDLRSDQRYAQGYGFGGQRGSART